ncbi:JmjC domain, hydroxylase-domain-containing protein, partial [Dimargaris cristalligena]
PVFRPTPLQFRDFSRFIAAAEPYARRAGLCKIIPPPEWLQELHHHQVQERGLKAEPTVSSAPTQRIFLASDDFPPMRPLVQHFEGSKGIYKQYNVENHRKVSLSRFYDLCVEARHTPPKSPPLAQPTSLAYTTARQLSIPSLPLQGSDDADSMDHMSPAQQPKLVDYFNDLDRNYWRNLSFGPPLYGADIPGTLFPPPPVFPTWNPQDLGTVLNRINIPMPGVNQPYLYLGMWKSTFAWHVEDMDLYSINFLHFGQPKSWYCIPPAHRARFERAMQSIFPEDARTCSEFLRHKAFLVSPSILKSQYDIPVHRLVQTQGEFIITFPNGYHAGFNQGFNCAESVNFALPSWVPLGKKAAPCKCIGDSVRIAVEE